MNAGRLRPVPETAERVLGLIRVSKERDGMVSPDVQRSAISDYSTARGYDVVEWLEGLDESGSRARSAWWPRLEQAVGMVEAGRVDVIVVWKYSRVARNRLRWATAVDRVESAGGRVESATEQVDTTTSTGRFTRGMLAELQAFEAERIGEVWKEVHERRVRSGRPATGKPKFGYRYDLEQKLHLPDPETGPVLADLYRRYVSGESVYTLVRWLNAHGVRTTDDGIWTDRSLRRVLDARFASGQLRSRGALVPGVHEPLIDDRLWRAYLDSRNRRRAAPARRERSQYLLSGLLRCSRCGGAMVAGQFGEQRAPKYRCARGKEAGPEACRGGYVMARFVEDHVRSEIEDLAAETDSKRSRRVAAGARRATIRSEQARVERELKRAVDAMAKIAVQHAEERLPEAVYRQAYDDLVPQIRELEAVLAELGTEERRAVVDPVAVARQLLKDWDHTQTPVLRETIARLIKQVDVTTGRPRAKFNVKWTFPREK